MMNPNMPKMAPRVSEEEINKQDNIKNLNDGLEKKLYDKYPSLPQEVIQNYVKNRSEAIGIIFDLVNNKREASLLTEEEGKVIDKLKNSEVKYKNTNNNLKDFYLQFDNQADKKILNGLAKKIIIGLTSGDENYVFDRKKEPNGVKNIEKNDDFVAKDRLEHQKKFPVKSREVSTFIEKNIDNIQDVIELKDNSFSNVVIFKKNKDFLEDEKLVRVYRGIRDVDTIEAVPYAQRSVDGNRNINVDYVNDIVKKMAHNPTMENLYEYLDAVNDDMTKEESKELDLLEWTSDEYDKKRKDFKNRPVFNKQFKEKISDEIKNIEDNILYGGSTARAETLYSTFGHVGGAVDSGMSPYVSASFDIKEASGYAGGHGKVLVIDIPQSEIDFVGNGDEAVIKGKLDKKFISAVMFKDGQKSKETEGGEDLEVAMEEIKNKIEKDVLNEKEMLSVRKNILNDRENLDKVQLEKDLDLIRKRRANKNIALFGKVFGKEGYNKKYEDIEQEAKLEGVDVYTKTKTMIFNYYLQKLEQQAGYNEEILKDVSFKKSNDFSKENYNIDRGFLNSPEAEKMLREMSKLSRDLEIRR